MKLRVPWEHDRCILCKQEGQLSDEHLIPELLGGALVSRMICTKCNSTLGTRVDAIAKTDPSICIAVWNLAGAIPKIAKKFFERNLFMDENSPGIKAVYKNDRYKILSSQRPDGSLIQSEKNAEKSIRRMLEKQGCDEKEIVNALREHANAPFKQRTTIAPGIDIVRSQFKPTFPSLKGRRMCDAFPLKIAFEYLALHFGESIYDSHLDEIRNSIITQSGSSNYYKIEYMHGEKYEPFHGLVLEETDPHIIIQIRLFGWIAYLVSFPIRYRGHRFIFTQFLDQNKYALDTLEDLEKRAKQDSS